MLQSNQAPKQNGDDGMDTTDPLVLFPRCAANEGVDEWRDDGIRWLKFNREAKDAEDKIEARPELVSSLLTASRENARETRGADIISRCMGTQFETRFENVAHTLSGDIRTILLQRAG